MKACIYKVIGVATFAILLVSPFMLVMLACVQKLMMFGG